MTFSRLASVILIGLGFISAEASFASLFQNGQHCVAYQAKKRMFLVAAVKVVGTSCQVAAQVIPDLDQQYHAEISFPISSLKSGEEERDSDVAKLLHADQESELLFTSENLKLDQWKELAAKGQFRLPGKLRIGTEYYPMEAEIQIVDGKEGKEVDGVVKTSFKNLHLKAPKLGLGLVANVKDELELHFHLLGTRVLGIDTLLAK